MSRSLYAALAVLFPVFVIHADTPNTPSLCQKIQQDAESWAATQALLLTAEEIRLLLNSLYCAHESSRVVSARHRRINRYIKDAWQMRKGLYNNYENQNLDEIFNHDGTVVFEKRSRGFEQLFQTYLEKAQAASEPLAQAVDDLKEISHEAFQALVSQQLNTMDKLFVQLYQVTDQAGVFLNSASRAFNYVSSKESFEVLTKEVPVQTSAHEDTIRLDFGMRVAEGIWVHCADVVHALCIFDEVIAETMTHMGNFYYTCYRALYDQMRLHGFSEQCFVLHPEVRSLLPCEQQTEFLPQPGEFKEACGCGNC